MHRKHPGKKINIRSEATIAIPWNLALRRTGSAVPFPGQAIRARGQPDTLFPICCLKRQRRTVCGRISISKDLWLEPRELAEGGGRIVSKGKTQLFALNPLSGSLVTKDSIDREELCAQSTQCLFKFEVLLNGSRSN